VNAVNTNIYKYFLHIFGGTYSVGYKSAKIVGAADAVDNDL